MIFLLGRWKSSVFPACVVHGSAPGRVDFVCSHAWASSTGTRAPAASPASARTARRWLGSTERVWEQQISLWNSFSNVTVSFTLARLSKKLHMSGSPSPCLRSWRGQILAPGRSLFLQTQTVVLTANKLGLIYSQLDPLSLHGPTDPNLHSMRAADTGLGSAQQRQPEA